MAVLSITSEFDYQRRGAKHYDVPGLLTRCFSEEAESSTSASPTLQLDSKFTFGR